MCAEESGCECCFVLRDAVPELRAMADCSRIRGKATVTTFIGTRQTRVLVDNIVFDVGALDNAEQSDLFGALQQRAAKTHSNGVPLSACESCAWIDGVRRVGAYVVLRAESSTVPPRQFDVDEEYDEYGYIIGIHVGRVLRKCEDVISKVLGVSRMARVRALFPASIDPVVTSSSSFFGACMYRESEGREVEGRARVTTYWVREDGGEGRTWKGIEIAFKVPRDMKDTSLSYCGVPLCFFETAELVTDGESGEDAARQWLEFSASWGGDPHHKDRFDPNSGDFAQEGFFAHFGDFFDWLAACCLSAVPAAPVGEGGHTEVIG